MRAFLEMVGHKSEKRRKVNGGQLSCNESDIFSGNALVDLLDEGFLVQTESHYERFEILPAGEDSQQGLRCEVDIEIKGIER